MTKIAAFFFSLATTSFALADSYQCSLQLPLMGDAVTMFLPRNERQGTIQNQSAGIPNHRIQVANPAAYSHVETSLIMRRTDSAVNVFVVNNVTLSNPGSLLMPMIRSIQQMNFRDGDRFNITLNLLDGQDADRKLADPGLKLNCRNVE